MNALVSSAQTLLSQPICTHDTDCHECDRTPFNVQMGAWINSALILLRLVSAKERRAIWELLRLVSQLDPRVYVQVLRFITKELHKRGLVSDARTASAADAAARDPTLTSQASSSTERKREDDVWSHLDRLLESISRDHPLVGGTSAQESFRAAVDESIATIVEADEAKRDKLRFQSYTEQRESLFQRMLRESVRNQVSLLPAIRTLIQNCHLEVQPSPATQQSITRYFRELSNMARASALILVQSEHEALLVSFCSSFADLAELIEKLYFGTQLFAIVNTWNDVTLQSLFESHLRLLLTRLVGSNIGALGEPNLRWKLIQIQGHFFSLCVSSNESLLQRWSTHTSPSSLESYMWSTVTPPILPDIQAKLVQLIKVRGKDMMQKFFHQALALDRVDFLQEEDAKALHNSKWVYTEMFPPGEMPASVGDYLLLFGRCMARIFDPFSPIVLETGVQIRMVPANGEAVWDDFCVYFRDEVFFSSSAILYIDNLYTPHIYHIYTNIYTLTYTNTTYIHHTHTGAKFL